MLRRAGSSTVPINASGWLKCMAGSDPRKFSKREEAILFHHINGMQGDNSYIARVS